MSSWLEGKEVQRFFQTPASWPLQEKSREYSIQREQNVPSRENNRNNNSKLKNEQPKQEDYPKVTPKITMRTWNTLTSDPATWPYKVPGVKPWPKDENGNSYNPHADLVRKLGIAHEGNMDLIKENQMKNLKQQKLEKNENVSSKVNTWVESNVDSSSNEHNNQWNGREKTPEDWDRNKANENPGSNWNHKWRNFIYHKVTVQPTSKTGMALDKPNSFIAVSDPRYDNTWRKNDIEEIGHNNDARSGNDDPDHPANQMRMNAWKKNGDTNATTHNDDKYPRADILQNQLENLKDKDESVMVTTFF